MFEINWLELVGYLASIIIMASMLMSSIIRLRWINLTGALLFSVYGFMIGAPPVGFLNGFIVLINIYHLLKIYRRKEYFKVLEIKPDDHYFLNFLSFYQDEISKLFPSFRANETEYTLSLFILRNMAIAGVFLGRETSPGVLHVDLDFVIPEYRDFKLGSFLFTENKKYLIERGYNTIHTYSESQQHTRYLNKMKFRQVKENWKLLFIKEL